MIEPRFLLLAFVFIIGALGAVLVLALVRLGVATRTASRRLRVERDDNALVTEALGAAVTQIREREEETNRRAVATERLSEQIIGNLSSGLLVVDVAGRVQILNPVGRQLLGVDEGEAGAVLRELEGGSVSPLADLVEECLSELHPIVRRTIELDPPGRDDMATHLGVSVSPMVDDDGGLQGAICLFADLTAIHDLEEQVRLQESLAGVGELAAGIAHEFRNGLAVIHGYCRLLPSEDVRSEHRPYLEGIRQGTAELREVVDQFLGFARPAQLAVSTVSLERLVERAADAIRGEVQQRGGDVSVRGEFPDVEGDEVLLRQAISNLCRNAVDACVDAERVPDVRLVGKADNDQARLTVTDNGPGFDPSNRDRMFRPFFTTKSHGTGLGLALTQKIIVTHNGSVTASLTEHGGARLEVILPLRRVPHHSPH